MFELDDTFDTKVTFNGNPMFRDFKMSVINAESSYINELNTEVDISIPVNLIHLTKSTNEYTLSLNKNELIKHFGFLPLYYKIDVEVYQTDNAIYSQKYKDIIGIIVNNQYNPIEFNNLLQNGFYIHGRAGIIDEINYFDDNRN